MKNYNAIAGKAEIIIKQAGEILLSYFNKTVGHTLKQDGSFVTEADVASEQFLIKELTRLIPEAGYKAEESGEKIISDYSWVIDPLDGTTNFAQGIPFFCISVALTYKNDPLFGAIYNPLLQEYFSAIKGEGAFLNGKKIQVSSTSEYDKSIVIFATPYVKNKEFFKAINHLEQEVYTSRTFGSAALDQAYCAAGRADAVIFKNLSWWDVAAGMLLLKESGAMVCDFQKNPITPEYKTFIASNFQLIDKLIQLINS